MPCRRDAAYRVARGHAAIDTATRTAAEVTGGRRQRDRSQQPRECRGAISELTRAPGQDASAVEQPTDRGQCDFPSMSDQDDSAPASFA